MACRILISTCNKVCIRWVRDCICRRSANKLSRVWYRAYRGERGRVRGTVNVFGTAVGCNPSASEIKDSAKEESKHSAPGKVEDHHGREDMTNTTSMNTESLSSFRFHAKSEVEDAPKPKAKGIRKRTSEKKKPSSRSKYEREEARKIERRELIILQRDDELAEFTASSDEYEDQLDSMDTLEELIGKYDSVDELSYEIKAEQDDT